MAESLQPVRPQCSRRFFHILAKVRQYGFDGTHDERQADEDEGYNHAQWRESDIQTERLYDPAHPAARSVKNSERNAGHGDWQSVGKVDQRVDDLLSGKLRAHQQPGNKQPEEGVDGGRNSSRNTAQEIGGNRHVRMSASHEFFQPHSSSTQELGAQGIKTDHWKHAK